MSAKVNQRQYDDDDKELGRHHALDVFRIVKAMGESDWRDAEAHREAHPHADYLKEARRIRREHFDDVTSLGLVRLREHADFQTHRDVFEDCLERFVTDLNDLLGEA